MIPDNIFEVLIEYINIARRYITVSNNINFRELTIHHNPKQWKEHDMLDIVNEKIVLYYERNSYNEIECWFRGADGDFDECMLKLIGFEEYIRTYKFESFMIVNDRFITRLSELSNFTDEEFSLYIKILNL